MAWKPYQDQQNRAYSSILTTLFPEQTKTLPRILVWSVVFLIDLTLVVCVSAAMGWLNHFLPLLVVLFGLFWLQGVLWGWVTSFFKKRKENHNVSL